MSKYVSSPIRGRRICSSAAIPAPLLLATIGAVLVGAVLPETPLAHKLGFTLLRVGSSARRLMVVIYVLVIEAGKRWFFRTVPTVRVAHPAAQPTRYPVVSHGSARMSP